MILENESSTTVTDSYTPQVLPAWLCCDVYVLPSASRIHWAPPCHCDVAMQPKPPNDAVLYSDPVYTNQIGLLTDVRIKASSVRVWQGERRL